MLARCWASCAAYIWCKSYAIVAIVVYDHRTHTHTCENVHPFHMCVCVCARAEYVCAIFVTSSCLCGAKRDIRECVCASSSVCVRCVWVIDRRISALSACFPLMRELQVSRAVVVVVSSSSSSSSSSRGHRVAPVRINRVPFGWWSSSSPWCWAVWIYACATSDRRWWVVWGWSRCASFPSVPGFAYYDVVVWLSRGAAADTFAILRAYVLVYMRTYRCIAPRSPFGAIHVGGGGGDGGQARWWCIYGGILY